MVLLVQLSILGAVTCEWLVEIIENFLKLTLLLEAILLTGDCCNSHFICYLRMRKKNFGI